MPLFSIITVCLNAKDGMARTAPSISKQKESNFEWIVIDGGSIDGTVEFIRDKLNPNFFVSEKDNGIYHAMNKGVKFAKGEYCLFLNAGDELYSSDVLSEVKKNLQADIVIGKMQVICHYDPEKNKIKDFSEQDIRRKFLYSRSPPHSATFIKKNIFSTYGVYDERFLIAGDHDFFARVLLKGTSISFAPVCVSTFYLDGISTKMKHSELLKKEMNQLRRKNFSFFYRGWRNLVDSFAFLNG